MLDSDHVERFCSFKERGIFMSNEVYSCVVCMFWPMV